MRYTWDENSNLTSRYDAIIGETETFGYDFLDRLISVSGPYTRSYSYDELGNITSMNGNTYAYGDKPHAVTSVNDMVYTYDANGNMTQRGDQTLFWDLESRLVGTITRPIEQWERTFGDTGDERAYSVCQTTDGGYIMAGYTASYGDGDYDALLVKMYANGDEQWRQTFDGEYNDFAFSVSQTSDGYILGGYTYSSATAYDFWLIKTDVNGNKVWGNTYDSGGYECASSVSQTFDGGYIITGHTDDYSDRDVWLVKTDPSGNKEWNWTFGGDAYDNASSVSQTSNGGYILAGYTYSYGAGDADVWLIKTHADGSLDWERKFGGSAYDYATSVSQTPDGGYIMAGYTASYGNGGDAWLIKTDANGNVEDGWPKTYGGISDECADSVSQTSDGGYIVAGRTYSYGVGSYDAWLVKTDASGLEQWSQTYGGTSPDYAYSVSQTSDGGYIVAGTTQSFGVGGFDAWVLKTDDGGNIMESVETAYVYDGDGNRVLKNEGGEIILYVNRYYEKNLTTGEETTHYYLGGRQIAYKNDSGLTYVHQDHLGSTTLTTDNQGNVITNIKYFPYGDHLQSQGDLATDKQFTGQRLDDSGLYFYNARYYDSTIGRFISADSIVPDYTNPQAFNRYSYVINNPLKYTDPTGHAPWDWVKEKYEEAVDWVEETTEDVCELLDSVTRTLTGNPRAIGSSDPIERMTMGRTSAAAETFDNAAAVASSPLSLAADILIPEGKTIGIGFNLQGGLGGGGSSTIMLVLDGSGSVGMQYSGGGGAVAPISLSLCPQLQITNADSIKQLKGTQVQMGGGGGPYIWEAGIEYAVGYDYQGVNIYGGPSFVPMWVEMHGIVEYGGVWVWRE